MRITFNTFPGSLMPRLQSLGADQNTALDQISSGKRLKVASDDPAAMGRVLNLRAEKLQNQQFWSNSGHATTLSKNAFAALNQLNSVGTRIGELAISGSNGTAPASSLNAYGVEANQLLENAVANANSKAQGNYLMSGTATDTLPFAVTRDAAGDITGVTYQGAADDGAVFRISESETISPSTTQAENLAVADFLNRIVGVRDALRSGSASAVNALRPGLTTSEDQLLAGLSRAGGVQYRLEVSISDSSTRFTSLQESISKESDVDFAEASVRLTRSQTAYQAAIQSAAKIMSTSLLDYIR